MSSTQPKQLVEGEFENENEALFFDAHLLADDRLPQAIVDFNPTQEVLDRALRNVALLGRAEGVRALLGHANPQAKDSLGQTALMSAVAGFGRSATPEAGARECLDLLLPLSDVAAESDEGDSALLIAVSTFSAHAVSSILSAFSDPVEKRRQAMLALANSATRVDGRHFDLLAAGVCEPVLRAAAPDLLESALQVQSLGGVEALSPFVDPGFLGQALLRWGMTRSQTPRAFALLEAAQIQSAVGDERHSGARGKPLSL